MKLPREIWIIATISLLSSIGLGIVVPSLPSLGEMYGVGVAAMSVAISGFAGARLVTNLGLTRILRLLPLRTVLIFGLLFQGTATLIAGLAPDYGMFVAFRILSGIGSASTTIASTALMVAIAPSDRRGRAMALQGGLTGIGTVTGPMVGGAVVLLNPQLPMLVYGSGMVVGSLVAIVLLRSIRHVRTIEAPRREDLEETTSPRGSRWRLPPMLTDRLFLTVILCQFVNGAAYYGTRMALLAAYLEAIAYTAAMVGVFLAVAALTQVAATSVAGPISDRVGRFPVLTVSYVFGLITFVAMQFADVGWLAFVAFAAMGLAGGLQQSTASALLADSPHGRTGAAASGFWITFDVAAIIGPTVASLVAENHGYSWVFDGVCALIALALANSAYMWAKTRRR